MTGGTRRHVSPDKPLTFEAGMHGDEAMTSRAYPPDYVISIYSYGEMHCVLIFNKYMYQQIYCMIDAKRSPVHIGYTT